MIYNIIINYKRQRERNKYVTFYYMERLFIIILKCPHLQTTPLL